MLEFKKREEALVDAIEGGKIVKVAEDYARREGLLILRKSNVSISQTNPSKNREEEQRKNKGFIGMEDLRKPLSIRGNEILQELIENFHWILIRRRKDRMLTRKKVATDIREEELDIKMIESGVLPANNFILINKLESYYGIVLRKNKPVGNTPSLRQVIDFKRGESRGEAKNSEVIIRPIKRSDGSMLREAPSQGARTPKWANRLKKEDSEPEIEIIEEDSMTNSDKAISDDDSDSDIIKL